VVWLLNLLKYKTKIFFGFRLVVSVVVVICVLLFLVAKIDCRTKTSTPSIYSSRVVSTADGLTSSCVVVEEGVPVCQDPDEEDNKYAILQIYSLNRISYILCIVVNDYYRASITSYFVYRIQTSSSVQILVSEWYHHS